MNTKQYFKGDHIPIPVEGIFGPVKEKAELRSPPRVNEIKFLSTARLTRTSPNRNRSSCYKMRSCTSPDQTMSFGDTLTFEVFNSMKSDTKFLFVVQLFPSDGKLNPETEHEPPTSSWLFPPGRICSTIVDPGTTSFVPSGRPSMPLGELLKI
jgi:hypothetical protein